jgi:hypothetical protein
MRRRDLFLVASLLTLSFAAFSQDAVKVIRQSEPQKALIIELSIPASQHEVWKAFTTSEGLSTWLTPGAVVDLREWRRVDRSLSRRSHRWRHDLELHAREGTHPVCAGAGAVS